MYFDVPDYIYRSGTMVSSSLYFEPFLPSQLHRTSMVDAILPFLSFSSTAELPAMYWFIVTKSPCYNYYFYHHYRTCPTDFSTSAMSVYSLSGSLSITLVTASMSLIPASDARLFAYCLRSSFLFGKSMPKSAFAMAVAETACSDAVLPPLTLGGSVVATSSAVLTP